MVTSGSFALHSRHSVQHDFLVAVFFKAPLPMNRSNLESSSPRPSPPQVCGGEGDGSASGFMGAMREIVRGILSWRFASVLCYESGRQATFGDIFCFGFFHYRSPTTSLSFCQAFSLGNAKEKAVPLPKQSRTNVFPAGVCWAPWPDAHPAIRVSALCRPIIIVSVVSGRKTSAPNLPSGAAGGLPRELTGRAPFSENRFIGAMEWPWACYGLTVMLQPRLSGLALPVFHFQRSMSSCRAKATTACLRRRA
jgi:hypothetical protein